MAVDGLKNNNKNAGGALYQGERVQSTNCPHFSPSSFWHKRHTLATTGRLKRERESECDGDLNKKK